MGTEQIVRGDEPVLGSWHAVHIRGAARKGVEGTLELSRTRLVFRPRLLGRAWGRRDWECALTKDVHVGVSHGGRLARFLGSSLAVIDDGVFDQFEIREADAAAQAINAALAAFKKR